MQNPLHGVENARQRSCSCLLNPRKNPLHGVENRLEPGCKWVVGTASGIHYMELKNFHHPRPLITSSKPRIHYMELKTAPPRPSGFSLVVWARESITWSWKTTRPLQGPLQGQDVRESITWSWKGYNPSRLLDHIRECWIHYMELKIHPHREWHQDNRLRIHYMELKTGYRRGRQPMELT